MIPPRATMRLQLHNGFTFADAAKVVPYMARLGVSHLYASPILTARPGSMHGYDVTDPTQVNPELGGEEGFRRLVGTLRMHRLGLILDIVPNHMAVGGQNAWWVDVLRLGQASQHAQVFDIDWHPDNPLLQGKVLLPILGKPYGDALESGEIIVARESGDWQVRYFDNWFPVRPEDAAKLTELGAEAYDAVNPEGRGRLHRLLERQHYRLAFWRTANDEINWRRFFDINELIGVRVEKPAVLEATHATLFRLYRDGLIDGVRIDHVDGLADPGSYCRTLRARFQELAPDRPAYIVVEKILGRGEQLPADWGVDGTSGYDFMDAVSAVQHDVSSGEALGALWYELTGRPAGFADEEVPARRETLARSFVAQLEACAGAFQAAALQNVATRDAGRAAIRSALVVLLAHFPVYRSYPGEPSKADQDAYRRALEGAKAAPEFARIDVIEMIMGLLRRPETPARQKAATIFQQLSAPVTAKSVEDTAFYRYGRLISRNDVGFDVATLGTEPDTFHHLSAERSRLFPGALLTTATHDHKRGEDVRARLAVLSEMPEEWGQTLRRWMARNARYRTEHGPSLVDEVMLYQTLVGVWLGSLDGGFEERIAAWQSKAMHEAKLETSWTSPNEAYEAAAREFLHSVLADGGFRDEVTALVGRIAAAGAVNGIAQALLKLTVAGVPDLYQGTEFWDFSLVDPDNRRPVDFIAREHALESGGAPVALARNWMDGRVKQAVIATALRARAEAPELFAEGEYIPLDGGQHLIAFVRRHQKRSAVVIAPRLVLGMVSDGLAIPTSAWGGASVRLPDGLSGTVRNVLTGDEVTLSADLPAARVLGAFPAALLIP